MVRRISSAVGMLFFCVAVFGDEPPAVTLDEIVKTIRSREKAIESLEVRGREFDSDRKGNDVGSSYYQEFLWAEASGGRREFRNVIKRSDGTSQQISWYRDDGRLSYGMGSVANSPDVVDSMLIKPMENTHTRNDQTKNSYINSMMPRGVLLSELVSTADSIEVDEDGAGNRLIKMNVNDNGFKLKLKLSPAYDYLPVSVDFSGDMKIIVTDFENVNGFWMPKSGRKAFVDRKGNPSTLAFQTDSIRINFGPDANRFGAPKLEPGAIIQDNISGKTRIHGVSDQNYQAAKNARDSFTKRNSVVKKSVPSTPDVGLSTRASPDPDSSSLRLIFVAGSLGFLAMAAWMSFRR